MQANFIRFAHFHKGRSLRSIARETGFDFRTVKKYAEKTDFNQVPKKRRGRPSKLDPYKPIIDTWLTEDLKRKPKQRHTAHRVYERLCCEYEGVFDVSERTVRDYVSAKKKELYGEKEGPLPLEHPPGEAQVDFGQVDMVEKGKRISGYELILSLPYSNGGYPQVFRGQNQECLLTGLKDIFEHMERVPRVIWFDNLSAAVASIEDNGKRKLVDQFARFVAQYNFEPRFCNPRQGHEKGHVENKVGYGRRNYFVPEPEFDDIEAFNRELFAVAEKDHRRQHYCKGQPIAELIKEDLAAMLPLLDKPFDVGRLEKIRANEYGKVKYDNNIYSASPQMAKKEVWVKASAHYVEILDENYCRIVQHNRCYEKGESIMDWFPYLTTLARRPNALKYTGFYRDLPMPWQEYLAGCDNEDRKKSLNLLNRMLAETDMDTATRCLLESYQEGTTDTDSILLCYRRLTEPQLTEFLPPLSAGIKPGAIYKPDLTCYDALLKAGEIR